METIYVAIISSRKLVTKEKRIEYVDKIAAQWRNPAARVDTLYVKNLPIAY
jgi:hypothetical protein